MSSLEWALAPKYLYPIWSETDIGNLLYVHLDSSPEGIHLNCRILADPISDIHAEDLMESTYKGLECISRAVIRHYTQPITKELVAPTVDLDCYVTGLILG